MVYKPLSKCFPLHAFDILGHYQRMSYFIAKLQWQLHQSQAWNRVLETEGVYHGDSIEGNRAVAESLLQ